MTESNLVRRIMDKVSELRRSGLRIKAVKFHGNQYTEAGTPDLHITFEGRSYWLEVKTGDYEPTELQKHRMNEWSESGAVSHVVRSVDAVLMALGIKG